MGFFKDLILRKKTSAKGEAFYCRFLGFLSLAFHLFCVDSWCYVFFSCENSLIYWKVLKRSHFYCRYSLIFTRILAFLASFFWSDSLVIVNLIRGNIADALRESKREMSIATRGEKSGLWCQPEFFFQRFSWTGTTFFEFDLIYCSLPFYAHCTSKPYQLKRLTLVC